MEKVLKVLKAGGLLQIEAPDAFVLLGDASHFKSPDTENLPKLQEFISSNGLYPVILIADIAQLYNYVAEIPEIAWDIIDFAEKPLEVIFDKGKNVAPFLLGPDGSIKIRLVKSGVLHKMAFNFNKALFLLMMPQDDQLKKLFPSIDHVLHLDLREVYPLGGRTLKLGKNGEIKFLK